MECCNLKYAVFLQTIGRLVIQPLVLYFVGLRTNLRLELLFAFIPIQFVGTPLGQYLQVSSFAKLLSHANIKDSNTILELESKIQLMIPGLHPSSGSQDCSRNFNNSSWVLAVLQDLPSKQNHFQHCPSKRASCKGH